MSTAVVLFNRDLRVHDHPALRGAVEASEFVVPLFVLDDDILQSDYARPNRLAFLLDCLRDLRAALRDRGGDLFVRSGEVVAETMAVVHATGAQALWVSEDYSSYARLRQRRRSCPPVVITSRSSPPTPAGGAHCLPGRC